MLTRKNRTKRGRLSRQILGLILLDAMISAMAYFTFHSWAGTIVFTYCEKYKVSIDELMSFQIDMMVANGSIVAASILFMVLFLVFVGGKLSYIRELTAGIEALRTHRMDYQLELKGDNELTELAESINYLAETERQLKAVERNLSHDIRTPLTAILSYAEYMQGKDNLTQEELYEFLELTKRKGNQIQLLTEQLLDGGTSLTEIEDGHLLMTQLVEEWADSLEEAFDCRINIGQCPDFARQLDVEELRRIFDNLASNVEKYADRSAPVVLEIFVEKGRIAIRQSNKKSTESRNVESRGIGLSSIDNIAKHHGGGTTVKTDGEHFIMEIILFAI